MNTNGHRYTVELRVYGTTLDPDLVTRERGLQPCQTRTAGSRLGSQVRSESMWGFDGGDPPDWESLEEGLRSALDKIAAAQPLFARYGREYGVAWWCGHFQQVLDGGPQRSPRLLGRLAAFGAPPVLPQLLQRRRVLRCLVMPGRAAAVGAQAADQLHWVRRGYRAPKWICAGDADSLISAAPSATSSSLRRGR